ncbi:MBL fold metallo-hydrolase [Patescibacteria group bacterium]|nr:MBL fold metallo-hydrolase [Patescibacteria group bacterium]
MKINWYGQSCFKIKNKTKTILIDPYGPINGGLKRKPNFKADIIVLFSKEKDKNKIVKLEKAKFLIDHAGEYEIKNVFIYGVDFIRENSQSIIYQIEIDNIRLGFLGEINDTLKDREIEEIDGMDVLFVPVGGENLIDPSQAMDIINSLEPKIVIPCCFDIQGIKTKLLPLENFLKEAGIDEVERLDYFTLKKKDLSVEKTKIIVLKEK